MPKPNGHATGDANKTQLLDTLTALLRRHLPLELKNTRIDSDEIWNVLSYAALNQTSLAAAADDLGDSASGNRLREVLTAALPPLPQLQRQLNTLFRTQLPRRVLRGKQGYDLAIDLTLIPYHGQTAESANEIVRNAAKAGTTHFHGYATVSVVHHQQRYVIAVVFVTAGIEMVTIVRTLLNRVRTLGIRIRLVLLDKGFYAGAVFRTLDRRGLSYIIPLRLGQKHTLFHRRGSYRTTHCLAHARGGAYRVYAVVLRRFKHTGAGKRKVFWLGYGCGGWTRRLSFRQVMLRYRLRFGIETSYRQMNQVRARTSSRCPKLRLLYIGIALLLVNGYVTLRCAFAKSRHHTNLPRLTLRRIVLTLRYALEQRFKVRSAQIESFNFFFVKY